MDSRPILSDPATPGSPQFSPIISRYQSDQITSGHAGPDLSSPIIIPIGELSLITSIIITIGKCSINQGFGPMITIDTTPCLPSTISSDLYIYRQLALSESISVEFPYPRPNEINIDIHGYRISDSPSKAHLILLLNASATFRQRSSWIELIYTDILCSLALIDARSYIQASEILYSAASSLHEHEQHMRQIDVDGEAGEIRLDVSSECLFLLAAAALVPTTSNTERMFQMLKNMVDLGHGKDDPIPYMEMMIMPTFDSDWMIYHPKMIGILCSLIIHRLPYIRQAAARTLEYVLECIGCECALFIPCIFQAIFNVHDVAIIEPIIEALLTNLSIVSAQTLQTLSTSVFQPSFDILINESGSINAIGNILRLWQIVFHRLKGDIQLKHQSILNMLRICSTPSYSSIKQLSLAVWDDIVIWYPYSVQDVLGFADLSCHILSKDFQQKPHDDGDDEAEIDTEQLSLHVPYFLDLLIRVASTKMQFAMDHPHLSSDAATEFMRIVPYLQEQIGEELSRGDHADMRIFHLLWDSLTLIITINNTSYNSEHISMDVFIDPILAAANRIITDRSATPSLIQIMQSIIPLSDNQADLYDFLSRFLRWIPHSVQDGNFDLLKIILVKLQPTLEWPQIKQVISTMIDRSTARSQASEFCGIYLQGLITESETFLNHLIRDLLVLRHTQKEQFDELLSFTTVAMERSNQISHSTIDAMSPPLTQLLGDHDRHIRLNILKLLKLMMLKSQCTTTEYPSCTILSMILASTQVNDHDPYCQFEIAAMMPGLFQTPSLYGDRSIVSQSCTILNEWAESTRWENVRIRCLKTLLSITEIHFSSQNINCLRNYTTMKRAEKIGEDDPPSSTVNDLYHDIINRLCNDRTSSTSRLWGLRLIWAVSFRTITVLASLPKFIETLIRTLCCDWDERVHKVASIMIDAIDGRHARDDVLVDEVLKADDGEVPSSITEQAKGLQFPRLDSPESYHSDVEGNGWDEFTGDDIDGTRDHAILKGKPCENWQRQTASRADCNNDDNEPSNPD